MRAKDMSGDRLQRQAVHQRSGKDEPPIRLFKSEWLERLTLTSLRVFLSVWLLIVGVQIACTIWVCERAPASLGWLLLGFIAWFPFEYVMHRFAFHLSSNNRMVKRIVWLMHTNHHVQPAHRLRTVMPLTVSIPLGILFETASVEWLGVSLGVAAVTGFFMGYVVYDFTHYACHNLPMKSRFQAGLKRHHLRHHFVNHDRNFSITAPLIDRIFSTHE
ncbi:fatty acid hydroxylase [Asaia sp. As-1742]|nr:fatty acid hydroxylase [Asaia sp. As-1742]